MCASSVATANVFTGALCIELYALDLHTAMNGSRFSESKFERRVAAALFALRTFENGFHEQRLKTRCSYNLIYLYISLINLLAFLTVIELTGLLLRSVVTVMSPKGHF